MLAFACGEVGLKPWEFLRMTPADYVRYYTGYIERCKRHYEGFALLIEFQSRGKVKAQKLIDDRFGTKKQYPKVTDAQFKFMKTLESKLKNGNRSGVISRDKRE